MTSVVLFFLGGGLEKLFRFFDGVGHLHRVVRGNIALSVAYNMAGFALVMMGMVGPLMAAVLMPISSLIVVVTTVFRIGRETWKF